MDFGKELAGISQKTSKQYQGQSVYKVNKKTGDFRKEISFI